MSLTLGFTSKKGDILIFINLNSLSSRWLTHNPKECYLFGPLFSLPSGTNRNYEKSSYIIIRKGEYDQYHKCDLGHLRVFSSLCKACHQYRKGILFEMLNMYRNGDRLATFHLLSTVSWLLGCWGSTFPLIPSVGLSSESLTCISNCLLDISIWMLHRSLQAYRNWNWTLESLALHPDLYLFQFSSSQ